MKKCTIETSTKQYEVVFGDCLQHMKQFIDDKKYSSILFVTDDSVAPLHLHTIQGLFGEDIHSFIIPSGETGKSFSVYYEIITKALELGLDRKSAIVALGGGVVGDAAGFVASTYMRGIGFIQVPTTILAHDSAVGGKVGINHELGKNMIGSFYQPDAVFYHLPFIETLPLEEVRSGFAEVIKHSLIAETPFFEELQEKIISLHNVSLETWKHFLYVGIGVKAKIVMQDEKENGVRAFLNFGHTFGHAIEKLYGFRHGEAVAIGMLFALWLSEEITGKKLAYIQLKEYIIKLGYPKLQSDVSEKEIMNFMKRDKKATYGEMTFVLLEEIGKPVQYVCNEETAANYVSKFLKEVSR